MRALIVSFALCAACGWQRANAESGYDLWLRYAPVNDAVRLNEYRSAFRHAAVSGDSPTMRAIRYELTRGLEGLLGDTVTIDRDGATAGLIVTTAPSASSNPEAFVISRAVRGGRSVIVVTGASDIGAMYGTFALLRELSMHVPVRALAMHGAPRLPLRILDHWDNLDRSVERGYAGRSLWNWNALPDTISTRYRDYARANASIGINGSVLTNVNANAQVLTPEYLRKVAAIANEFRPYGIRVYLTARFSAPIELGHLPTADPLDPAVRAWWREKVDEIYRAIPDFGGFLVKANSEGQPGPQEYHRTHADGANMFAEALAPHHGIVMWRAFVYSDAIPADRVKQAYDEFTPLDGKFASDVLVQVKNGPLDFQPREPFHPLFGAMPRTPLMLEFQITKEYLGQDTHLVYLGPLFSEVLRADTYAHGRGSLVARTIGGIAGVSNVGTDSNWTGSQFNQANWYAFGRLAWDYDATPDLIAREWVRQTFSNDPSVVDRIVHMMLVSREAVVNYMTPLGLAHIMASGHHYGPGPWATVRRPDQSPPYFHRADSVGLGFDRTKTGSNAVAQYFPPVRNRFADRGTVPDALLLWFHHVGWTERLRSGRTLWDELSQHYQAGVDTVRSMQHQWDSVRDAIDAERFREVKEFLAIQAAESRWWRDAVLQYFQTFSHLPLPAGVDPPAHSLEFYEHLRCPRDQHKPRCPELY